MQQPVILFDGVCNLCNNAVNFVIRHDRDKKFKFASLQSNAGEQLRKNHAAPPGVDSIMLLEGKRFFMRSTAALRIARALPFPFYLLYGFIIVPAFIRNFIYDYVAANRYKWFGKKETCMMPDAGVAERFL